MTAEVAGICPEASNANKAMTHIVGVLTQFAMAFASYPDNLRVEVVREEDHLIATVFCHEEDIGRMRGADQKRIALMTEITREIATRFQIYVTKVKIRPNRQMDKGAKFAPIAEVLPLLEVEDIPSGRRRFIRAS